MRSPALESTANRLDHPRIAIEPQETVGAEIDHPASAHGDLAARSHLIDHQVLQLSLWVRPFKILEDPHELVPAQGTHQLIYGQLDLHGLSLAHRQTRCRQNPIVRLEHHSPGSLDWRTWEVRRIRRADSRGSSWPGR